MKKLILSLLICFAWLGAMQAQVLSSDFLMYGQVTRTSDNTPVANHQVIVYEMNNTVILWSDTVLTNASGNYSYTVVNGSTTGPNRIFYAKTYDCQNAPHIVQQQNNQGTTDLGIYNFEICDFSNTCQAAFSYGTSGSNTAEVLFADASTVSAGSISSWSWSFGDGTSSTLANPGHVYSASGVYSACLTISTTEGCTSTYCDSVVVTSPCQNAAGIVNQANPGSTAFFGYATWNGQIVNNATYSWNWGDGNTTTGGPTTQHQYANPGIYNVCVTIAYNGCTSTTCQSVTITSPCSGAAGFVNQTATNDLNFVGYATWNGQIVNNANFVWFWADSTTSTGGPTVTHDYVLPGVYNICVSVTYNGCSDTYCQQVTMGTPPPCNANFTYTQANIPYAYYVTPVNQGGQWLGQYTPNPNGLLTFPGPGTYNLCYIMYMSGDSCDYCQTFVVGNGVGNCVADFDWYYANNAQTAVVFDNNSDSNNNGAFVSYQWSFGDGTSSTNANPDHQYAQPGYYTVCLTATTANGCTSTYCDSVAIAPANQPCQAAFTTTYSPFPAPTGPGGVYVFNSTADPNLYHVWNINGEQIYTTSATYSFIGSGSFQVCLTVYSNNGCQDSECQTIVAADSTNNGACQSSFVFYASPNAFEYTFQSTSDPNLQHVWNINGETITGLSAGYVFPGPGTYQVCLNVSGDSCYASYCDVIYVGGQDSAICNAAFTYVPTNTGYIFNSASDHSLFHDWVIDNTFTYQGYDFDYPLDAGTHVVCLTVYNGSGCQDTECQTIVVSGPNPNCNATVSGTVTYADVNCSICVDDAIALLYQLTAGDSGTVATLVDVTLVNQGAYSFTNVCGGDYIVQAMIAPNSANYLLYMPTYGFSNAQWYNSPVINVVSGNNYDADIALIPVSNSGGNGVIGGGIVIPGLDSVRAIGPVQGIKVYLTTPAGDYVAYTMSDGNGQFTIGNLPYGTYNVCADYPGYMTSCTQVTLDAANPTITDLQFDFEHATVGVEEEVANVDISNLYPNPANTEAFITVELKERAKLNINIINALGQVVYSQNVSLQAGKQLLNIPVSNLAQGLYTLSITDDMGNKPVTRKLLKY